MRLLRSLHLMIVGAVALGAACTDADDPVAPTVAQVAGSYRATTLKTTRPFNTQDLLKSGASLTMQFKADGTLIGHITIPTESVDQDFSGGWEIEGDEVDLENIGADTFVEDLEFDVRGTTLVADRLFDGVRVQVVMTKQAVTVEGSATR